MLTTVLLVLELVLPPRPGPQRTITEAVEAALPQLIAGATGHIDQKSCFACHNQAFPALAFAVAREHGFTVAEKQLTAQAEHVTAFLQANLEKFRKGEGTGGQVDTAGYALFTLEMVGHAPDEATAAVVAYLLKTQAERDHWRSSSNRPPSEVSHFTTTYFALRGLRTYGTKADAALIAKRVEAARGWLKKSPARDTEDRVFRLLALQQAQAPDSEIAAAAWELLKSQQSDGGWAQLNSMASDSYATGTALYALHRAGGLKVDSPAYRAGVTFLLKAQLPDGTWWVRSRSKPFQPYYESGFPHEKNQFISITATGWATAALAVTVEKPSGQ